MGIHLKQFIEFALQEATGCWRPLCASQPHIWIHQGCSQAIHLSEGTSENFDEDRRYTGYRLQNSPF